MEIAGEYRRRCARSALAALWGLAGEPALGPHSRFPRPSAVERSHRSASLARRDAHCIRRRATGVFTARWKAEASRSTDEPDENRWDLDPPRRTRSPAVSRSSTADLVLRCRAICMTRKREATLPRVDVDQ